MCHWQPMWMLTGHAVRWRQLQSTTNQHLDQHQHSPRNCSQLQLLLTNQPLREPTTQAALGCSDTYHLHACGTGLYCCHCLCLPKESIYRLDRTWVTCNHICSPGVLNAYRTTNKTRYGTAGTAPSHQQHTLPAAAMCISDPRGTPWRSCTMVFMPPAAALPLAAAPLLHTVALQPSGHHTCSQQQHTEGRTQ